MRLSVIGTIPPGGLGGGGSPHQCVDPLPSWSSTPELTTVNRQGSTLVKLIVDTCKVSAERYRRVDSS